ncbi:MAG: Hsp20/alpha crystallin family protein [Simplicispira sp.]|nr:Hsp20/alpha crystallin family protein [Simplicispira sp.]MDD2691366.1 Hsp20/alpha crystallin family protein [Simplicispira sp.]
MPADIDAAQCKAKYDNGILTLPKQQGGSAQRLAIE